MQERQRNLIDAASLVLWRQVTETSHSLLQPHAPTFEAVLSMGCEVSAECLRDILRSLLLMRAAVEGRDVIPLPECIKKTPAGVPPKLGELVSDPRQQGLLARAYGAPRTACPHNSGTVFATQWAEGWDGFVAGR